MAIFWPQGGFWNKRNHKKEAKMVSEDSTIGQDGDDFPNTFATNGFILERVGSDVWWQGIDLSKHDDFQLYSQI